LGPPNFGKGETLWEAKGTQGLTGGVGRGPQGQGQGIPQGVRPWFKNPLGGVPVEETGGQKPGGGARKAIFFLPKGRRPKNPQGIPKAGGKGGKVQISERKFPGRVVGEKYFFPKKLFSPQAPDFG